MGQGASSSSPPSARDDVFAADYLSKYVDAAPGRNQQSMLLEERFDDTQQRGPCCIVPFSGRNGGDGRLVSAGGHKPFDRGDAQALSEGVDCREVCRTFCFTDSIGKVVEDGEVRTCEGHGYFDVDHSRSDAEVVLSDKPAQLRVPKEFKGIGYDWSRPSTSQQELTGVQQEKLQASMKPFIRAMLTGVLVQLRLEPGEAMDLGGHAQTIDSVVSLSEDLSLVLINVAGTERSVPIRAVRWVRPPESGADWDKCADLRLAGGRFIRFRFNNKEQVGYFGTCMRLLVKAARTNPAGASSMSVATRRA